jgi:hypothetical protein
MIVRAAPLWQALIASCALAAGLATFGCTEKLVEPPAAPSPTTLAAPDSIQQIFTAHCASSGCHSGSSPAQNQNLEDGITSYAQIVDVAAGEKPSLKRIAPGDSANSYLVMKLKGTPGIVGQRMPRGAPALGQDLISRIAAWAQAGAPGVVVPAP